MMMTIGVFLVLSVVAVAGNVLEFEPDEAGCDEVKKILSSTPEVFMQMKIPKADSNYPDEFVRKELSPLFQNVSTADEFIRILLDCSLVMPPTQYLIEEMCAMDMIREVCSKNRKKCT